jgi:hypothetical protein
VCILQLCLLLNALARPLRPGTVTSKPYIHGTRFSNLYTFSAPEYLVMPSLALRLSHFASYHHAKVLAQGVRPRPAPLRTEGYVAARKALIHWTQTSAPPPLPRGSPLALSAGCCARSCVMIA